MNKSARQNNIKCPFCGTTFYRSDMSYVSSRLYLKRMKNRLEIYPLGKNVSASSKLKEKHPELIRLEMSACPNCHRITVRAVGIGDQYKHKKFNIYPQFDAVPLPKYVPDQIRQDYKEAVEVVAISPNSAAMLSRRILEEVINDFYQIQEGDLFHDLDYLRKSNVSSSRIWQAIDAIRRLGNISVHSSQNVNDVFGNVSIKGAKQIIGLIRMLIHDTYVEQRLNHRLEKSVIRSAKKLNYSPHYYSDPKHRSSHRHYNNKNYRSHWHSNHSRHRRSNHRRKRVKRKRRNSRKSRKYHRIKNQRNQKSKARKVKKRRSNRRSKKNRVKNQSYTIIQNK